MEYTVGGNQRSGVASYDLCVHPCRTFVTRQRPYENVKETGGSQQEASRDSLEMEVSSKLQVGLLVTRSRSFFTAGDSMMRFTDSMPEILVTSLSLCVVGWWYTLYLHQWIVVAPAIRHR